MADGGLSRAAAPQGAGLTMRDRTDMYESLRGRGMRESEIVAALGQYGYEAPAVEPEAPPAEDNPVLGTNIIGNLGYGVQKTAEDWISGIGHGLEDQLGVEGAGEIGEWAGSYVGPSDEQELYQQKRQQARVDAVESGEMSEMGRFAGDAGDALVQSAPSMAPAMAGAWAGGAAGAALGAGFFGIGAVPGAAIGALVGGAAASIPMLYEESRDTAERNGLDVNDPDVQNRIAMAALGKSALENLAPMRVIMRLKPGRAAEILQRTVAKHGAKAALGDAAVEGLTEVGQLGIDALMTDEELRSKMSKEDWAEVLSYVTQQYGREAALSLAAGAGMGGAAGAASGTAEAIIDNAKIKRDADVLAKVGTEAGVQSSELTSASRDKKRAGDVVNAASEVRQAEEVRAHTQAAYDAADPATRDEPGGFGEKLAAAHTKADAVRDKWLPKFGGKTTKQVSAENEQIAKDHRSASLKRAADVGIVPAKEDMAAADIDAVVSPYETARVEREAAEERYRQAITPKQQKKQLDRVRKAREKEVETEVEARRVLEGTPPATTRRKLRYKHAVADQRSSMFTDEDADPQGTLDAANAVIDKREKPKVRAKTMATIDQNIAKLERHRQTLTDPGDIAKVNAQIEDEQAKRASTDPALEAAYQAKQDALKRLGLSPEEEAQMRAEAAEAAAEEAEAAKVEAKEASEAETKPAEAETPTGDQSDTAPVADTTEGEPAAQAKGDQVGEAAPAIAASPTAEVTTSGVHLPDDPGQYFNTTHDTKTVPVAQLRPMKGKPTTQRSAGNAMRRAYDGKGEKRGPLTVREETDGTYTVLEGNSTYANMAEAGWENAPVRVISDDQHQEEGAKRLRDKGLKAAKVHAHGGVTMISVTGPAKDRAKVVASAAKDGLRVVYKSSDAPPEAVGPAVPSSDPRRGGYEIDRNHRWVDKLDEVGPFATQEEVERWLADNAGNVEHSAAFGPDGKLLGIGTNSDANAVMMPKRAYAHAGGPDAGVIQLHTHPTDTTFSNGDIEVMRDAKNVVASRVVLPGGSVIEMRPTPELHAMNAADLKARMSLITHAAMQNVPLNIPVQSQWRIRQEAVLRTLDAEGLIEYSIPIDNLTADEKEAVNDILDRYEREWGATSPGSNGLRADGRTGPEAAGQDGTAGGTGTGSTADAAPAAAGADANPVTTEEVIAQIKALQVSVKALKDAGLTPGQAFKVPMISDAYDNIGKSMLMVPSTADRAGYGTLDDLNSREYVFDGEKVIGADDGVTRLVEEAKTLAARELKLPVRPVAQDHKALIIIGPPAAGKSTVANRLAYDSYSAIVDSDEAKKILPEYADGAGAAVVHEESSDLGKALMHAMTINGTNVVIPKVGDSVRSIQKVVDDLKSKGYEVRLVLQDVTPTTAMDRMSSRFANTGRLIPPFVVNEVGRKPQQTFEAMRADRTADGFLSLDGEAGYGEPLPVKVREGFDDFTGDGLSTSAVSLRYGGRGDARGTGGTGAGDEGAGGAGSSPDTRAPVAQGVDNLLPTDTPIDTEYPRRVSVRRPTSVNPKENFLTEDLQVSQAVMEKNPKFGVNVDAMASYKALRDEGGTNHDRAMAFRKQIKENLIWLHNAIPKGRRDMTAQWYHGANRIARQMATTYGKSTHQMAGVIASLSPQNEWSNNLSAAERLVDTMSHQQDTEWSPQMDAITERVGHGNKPNVFKNKANIEEYQQVRGKRLRELTTDVQKAMWVRAYDEAHNPRKHRMAIPDGRFVGEPVASSSWGSFSEMGNAIAIFEDGSLENISLRTGNGHKVRSFYNNIAEPDADRGDVTMDTHAVAAALYSPLSGNSTQVYNNFGSGPDRKQQAKMPDWITTSSQSDTGASGTYGIIADAYRDAAKELGIKPRELQSITWEAVREHFTADWKSPVRQRAVDKIWQSYKDDNLTVDEARKQVYDYAKKTGGVQEVSPDSGTDVVEHPSAYKADVSGDGRVDGSGRGGGTGSRTAAAAPKPAIAFGRVTPAASWLRKELGVESITPKQAQALITRAAHIANVKLAQPTQMADGGWINENGVVETEPSSLTLLDETDPVAIKRFAAVLGEMGGQHSVMTTQMLDGPASANATVLDVTTSADPTEVFKALNAINGAAFGGFTSTEDGLLLTIPNSDSYDTADLLRQAYEKIGELDGNARAEPHDANWAFVGADTDATAAEGFDYGTSLQLTGQPSAEAGVLLDTARQQSRDVFATAADAGQGGEGTEPVTPTPGEPAPLYVNRPVIDDGGLLKHFADLGLTDMVSPEDLHVTVTYSSAPVDVAKVQPKLRGREVSALGKPRILGTSLVQPITVGGMALDHNRYRSAGASHDYPEYLPHITIKQNATAADLKMASAKSPKGKVQLGPEVQAVLKTEDRVPPAAEGISLPMSARNKAAQQVVIPNYLSVQIPKTGELLGKMRDHAQHPAKSLNTTLSFVERQFFNRMAPIRRLEIATRGKMGVGAESPFKAAEMAVNDSGRAETLLFYGAGMLGKHGEFRTKPGTVGIRTIFDYAVEGAPDKGQAMVDWMAFMVARRAKDLRAKGTKVPVTDTEINAALAKSNPAFIKAADAWKAHNDANIEFLIDTGRISKAAGAALLADPHYVPFYRDAEKHVDGTSPDLDLASYLSDAGGRTGGHLLARDPGIKKMIGGDKQAIDNLMHTMVKNSQAMVAAGMRNHAANLTFDLLVDAGQAQIVKKGTIASGGFSTKPKDAIVMYRDGKEKYVRVSEDAIPVAVAMAAMTPVQLSGVTKLAANIGSIFRQSITLSPSFMLRNAIRGAVATGVMTSGANLRGQNNTLTGFYDAMRKGDATRAFTHLSGMGDYRFGGTDVGFGANDILIDYGIGKANAGYRIRQLLNQFEKVGTATELADRIAAFETMKKNGVREDEAAYQALTVMNYGRHGSNNFVRTMLPMVPFLNARLQGLSRLTEGALGVGGSEMSRGRAMTQLAINGAILSALGAALWAWNNSDEEKREKYKAEPQYRRLNYHIVYLGDKTLLIPKAFELGAVFNSIPEMLLDAAANDMGDEFKPGIMSILGQTLIFNAIPAAATPIIEGAANHSFFKGQPIEGMREDKLLARDRTEGASAASILVGQKIGVSNLTGLSPTMLEHYAQGYGGVFYSLLSSVIGAIGPEVGLTPPPVQGAYGTVPVISPAMTKTFGSMMKATPLETNKYLGQFYDDLDHITQIYTSAKAAATNGDVEYAKQLLAEVPGLPAARKMINKANYRMGKLNSAIRLTRSDPKLSSSEKAKALEPLIRERNELARQVTETVDQIEESQGQTFKQAG